MIVEIPVDNSIVKWKMNDKDEWKVVEISDLIKAYERPQGEREFIEILTQYLPDDLCTYPEFKRKPYYSIRYRENGEEFVGYGTYNIKVLSRYLKDYFFNTEMEGGTE